jgi:signal transduction histidine kinase
VALREQRDVDPIEHSIIAPDGDIKWLSVNAAPLLDEDGQLYGAVAGFRDISESKRSEEALRLAQVEVALGIQQRSALEERQRLARELHDSVSRAVSHWEHTGSYLVQTDRSKV